MTQEAQPAVLAMDKLSLKDLDFDQIFKAMGMEDLPEVDREALIGKGNGFTKDVFDKFNKVDFNDEQYWTIFEIKHLKILFAEYQNDKDGVYVSVKTCQYEGDVCYIISFNKEQVLLKNSGAVGNLDPSVFVTLDYCKDYVLEMLEHYITISGDGIGFPDKASLKHDLYK